MKNTQEVALAGAFLGGPESKQFSAHKPTPSTAQDCVKCVRERGKTLAVTRGFGGRVSLVEAVPDIPGEERSDILVVQEKPLSREALRPVQSVKMPFQPASVICRYLVDEPQGPRN